jgi:hypothetical protein
MTERISVDATAILQAAATLVAGRISGQIAAGSDAKGLDTNLWLIEAMYQIEDVVAEFEENRRLKNPK